MSQFDSLDEFVVRNRNGNALKLIPYIGCKAGFHDIFDEIIPDDLNGQIYDVFGGGGSFSFYACQRFGSHRVCYNDNNPILVNLIRCLQTDPTGLWEIYNEHYLCSSTEHYYEVRTANIGEGVRGAGNFLYLAKNAFSGKIRFNAQGRFNSPIRKGSSCPRLELDSLVALSSIIAEMALTNQDYTEFSSLRDALIYLDPPFFNNTNGHYNSVLDLAVFNGFLRDIEQVNKVILSEQNPPEIFELPTAYTVHRVTLKRSLQYVTQRQSQEIIALN